MTDVARRAGVSTMTVSNVINGRSQRVSESTKRRVLATIAELGYHVNMTARNLRMGRTGAVGLAVPGFAPGYYAERAGRLADRFAADGMRLVVERTGASRAAELDALTAARLSSYDGFVLSVVAGHASDLEKLSIDTPVVLIGERSVPARFDHVLMDNVTGARMATELLIHAGSRRIVLLGGVFGAEESMPELRTRGYRDAHEAAGLAVVDELIVPSGFGVDGGHAATQGGHMTATLSPQQIPTGVARRATGWRVPLRERIAPYAYIAPFFLLFGVFGLVPFLFTFYIALFEWNPIGDQTFIGVDNFTRMLADPRFWNATGNTISIWALSTIPQLLVALALAHVLNHARLRSAV